MHDIIKKGTVFECTTILTEGGEGYLLNPGDTFIQSRDNTTPVQEDHAYGSGWMPYMKIIKLPSTIDKDWKEILEEISPTHQNQQDLNA